MIECAKHKATVSESNCVARQKIIGSAQKRLSQEGKHLNGHLAARYNDIKIHCEGCKIGLTLYNKLLQEKKIMEKICTKCSKKKTLDLFYKQSSSKDGHHPYCKRCHNLYMDKKNTEKRPAKTLLKSKKIKQIPLKKSEPVKHTCKGPCGKKLELTPDNYQKDASRSTGFSPVCKTCRNKQERDRRAKKNNVLTIDFSDHPEVLKKIEGWAKSWMRHPEDQVLYYLATGDLEKGEVA